MSSTASAGLCTWLSTGRSQCRLRGASHRVVSEGAQGFGEVGETDGAEIEGCGVPALEVEAGLPAGFGSGGEPGALTELVGDGLAGPAEVAHHLGVHAIRLGAAAVPEDRTRPLEGPSRSVGQREVEVDADVD